MDMASIDTDPPKRWQVITAGKDINEFESIPLPKGRVDLLCLLLAANGNFRMKDGHLVKI